MKLRSDFVTNSSSSSFIFGQPGGYTTSITDVIKQVKTIASGVVSYTGKVLYQVKTSAVLNRMFINVMSAERQLESGDSSNYIERYTRYSNLKHKLEANTALRLICQMQFKDSVFEEHGLEFDEICDDILKLVTSSEERKHVKNIAKHGLIAVDFRSSSDTCDPLSLMQVVDWDYNEYGTKGEQYKSSGTANLNNVSFDNYNYSSKELKSCIFNNLGEVGIITYEYGDIPDAITDVMTAVARISCKHMG